MTKPKITNKRARLMAKIESIIGNNCYNDNIQNWGPHGTYEGEGREFRYPITFIGENGEKIKRRWTGDMASAKDAAILKTGYYAFGANRLHIMKALNEVIDHLENEHGFKI